LIFGLALSDLELMRCCFKNRVEDAGEFGRKIDLNHEKRFAGVAALADLDHIFYHNLTLVHSERCPCLPTSTCCWRFLIALR